MDHRQHPGRLGAVTFNPGTGLFDTCTVAEFETLDELDYTTDLIVASSWRDPVVWCNVITSAAAVTLAYLVWRRR